MSRKKAILAEPNETSGVTSTNNSARPQRRPRERLTSSVLEELWSIWRTDPRVPSVRSRRSWAISRNANPRLVDHWFCRRRTCAKKAGQPISDEAYDLPLDSGPLIAPKREESVEPGFDPFSDLPSDDTLALVYPPDDDDFKNIEASSDTALDDVPPVEPKGTETPAYTEVPQEPHPQHDHSQQSPSSAEADAPEDRCDEDVSFENSTLPICNQGQGKQQSDFTCVLCSAKSVQDEVLSDSNAVPNAKTNPFLPCPRLDFSPDTLSELSAIPFLFRTPRAVLAENPFNHPNTDDWTILEDELGHVVNEGKLDFSFLDVPELASMELLD